MFLCVFAPLFVLQAQEAEVPTTNSSFVFKIDPDIEVTLLAVVSDVFEDGSVEIEPEDGFGEVAFNARGEAKYIIAINYEVEKGNVLKFMLEPGHYTITVSLDGDDLRIVPVKNE